MRESPVADLLAPVVAQRGKVELCTSTRSPEGNAKEPGCLAEEEGPERLGSKIS